MERKPGVFLYSSIDRYSLTFCIVQPQYRDCNQPRGETWMATKHPLQSLGLVESMEIDVIDFLCSRIVMMCSGQDRAVVSG